ncbi:hypothetical protein SDJN03_21202, partial [Cucurbita argyrosperma subsp. sororia]
MRVEIKDSISDFMRVEIKDSISYKSMINSIIRHGDLATVYTLLMNSMSGDESVRKQAELALSDTDSRYGFHSCLLELITSPVELATGEKAHIRKKLVPLERTRL